MAAMIKLAPADILSSTYKLLRSWKTKLFQRIILEIRIGAIFKKGDRSTCNVYVPLVSVCIGKKLPENQGEGEVDKILSSAFG